MYEGDVTTSLINILDEIDTFPEVYAVSAKPIIQDLIKKFQDRETIETPVQISQYR